MDLAAADEAPLAAIAAATAAAATRSSSSFFSVRYDCSTSFDRCSIRPAAQWKQREGDPRVRMGRRMADKGSAKGLYLITPVRCDQP